MKRIIVSLLFVLCSLSHGYGLEEDLFAKFNPNDGGYKYRFARSYITSLSYYDRIIQRLKEQDPIDQDLPTELAIIRRYIDNLVLDNTDLRIAKNYLAKYIVAENQLMKKVADEAYITYEALIDLNKKEQREWRLFYGAKASQSKIFDEKEFGRNLKKITIERKKISQALIEASVLLTKVLISEESGEDGQILALTEMQRQNLIGRLDEFAHDNLDWGLLPGQSALDACVATIREILEDSFWEFIP